MRSRPCEILLALILITRSRLRRSTAHSTPVMKPTVLFSTIAAISSFDYVVLAVPALPKVGAMSNEPPMRSGMYRC